jgi:hypothetical protein
MLKLIRVAEANSLGAQMRIEISLDAFAPAPIGLFGPLLGRASTSEGVVTD